MLITAQNFIDSGIRVSSDISDSEINMAIITVEQFYLKNRIGDTNYADLNTNPATATNYILLNGGTIDDVVIAGLKLALYHLVYAYLLTDTMRITRYSTMEKNSEFSKNSEREDILEQARVHWNVGMSFVGEVEKYYGLDNTRNNTNNLFCSVLF